MAATAGRQRMLIPPYRFAIVEENVYRGAYPVERNLPFLKTLQLRTVVAVVPTAPTAPWAAWCADNGVRLIHIPCEIYKEKNPVNNTIASRVLERLAAQLLIDPEAHPIFLHCMNGAEVTGLLVMCLRKLQMWSQTFALIEFSRSLREGIIAQDQTDFVDQFSGEVTLPARLPRWLWEGKPLARRHPTIKLVYAASGDEATQDSQQKQLERENLKRKVNEALIKGGELRVPDLFDEAPYSLAIDALALE